MRNKILSTLLSATCFACAGSAFATEPASLSALPGDAKQVCDVSATNFADTWAKITFPGGVLPPFGPVYDVDSGLVYVFPPNGPAFTDVSSEPTNCAFFKWGAQMFYWLTSTVHDQGTLPSAPKPPSDTTPFVFASEFFYRLSDFTTLVPQGDGGSGSTDLALRATKPQEPVDTVGQAGFTNGVLFTQADTDVSTKSSLVYYGIHTNRPYGYVREALIRKAGSPYDFSEFPDDKAEICNAIGYGFETGYIDPKDPVAKLLFALYCPDQSVGATMDAGMTLPTEGLTLPKIETAVDYLAMTVELKTSWVETASLAHPERYIRHTGTIPVYTPSNDGNSLVQTGTREADLAMVGMHIVGSVKGHPEMIWATFEHFDNTPNVEYHYLDSAGMEKTRSDLTSQTNGDWLLSNGTGGDANAEYAVTGSSSSGTPEIVASDSNPGVPVSTPSNVNRLNPWGSPATAAWAETNSEVISTNVTAIKALSGFYGSSGLSTSDPRLYYMMTGASWGENGQFPTGMDVSQIAGTPSMANTTMETFKQTDATGCFSCHGISSTDSKFDISHIFGGITTVKK